MAKRGSDIPRVGDVREWVRPLGFGEKFVIWKIAKTTPASEALCEIRYLDGAISHYCRYYLKFYSRVIE